MSTLHPVTDIHPVTESPLAENRGARRHVELESVFNFRDLGGYPTIDGRTVRWERLFRADGIHRLVPEDFERIRGLGLRTVLDLRTAAELDHGRFPVDDDRVSQQDITHHHLPVITEIWDDDGLIERAEDYLVARYVEMLAEGGPAFAEALRLLADPASYPLVFHCAAGKDRTGVTAALVLGVLRVADDLIAHDYSLSAESMGRLQAWLEVHSPKGAEAMARHPQAWKAAPPEAMHLFLDHVRAEHGSFEHYLVPHGVDRATVDAVRDNLLV